jgi:DNA-binding CsgD family transcriptional regulator
MTERELIRLYNNGALIQDIADRAGMARGTINNKLCALRRAGKIGRRPQNPSQERVRKSKVRAALVEKYRKLGLTNEEIAAKVGISIPRVWQIVQELIAEGKIDTRVNRFQ